MPSYSFRNPLRRKLKAGETAYGLWVTLETPTVTEVAGEMGLDWVCIELEHGSLDYRDVLSHLRAAKGADTAVLARLPNTAVDTVKRCLDLGCDGVLLPLVRCADDLRAGFEFARYPPVGARGLGHERAVRWVMALDSYIAAANEETLVIPVIETKDASDNIVDILGVPGLEVIFFGPGDLSSSRGHIGVWEGPGVAEDIRRMTKLALEGGIATGIIGLSAGDIRLRQEQGFRMIALGSDVGMMIQTIRSLLTHFKPQTFEKSDDPPA